VEIPAGLDVEAFRSRASQLANATRSMACRVRPAQTAGLVWLEFQRRDALAALVPALPVPTAPARAEELRADLALGIDFTAIRVGVREDGNVWSIPLLARHVLVAGRSRSGKGSVLWSVLRELAPAIRVGLVKVTGIDPKGGMELEIGRPLFHRYEADQLEAMVELLEREADDMDAVARSLAGDVRKFTPSLEHPLHLVVIDELATLTAYAPLELRRRAEMALGRLQTKGAAVGWVVFGCVQEPTKDIIPMRGLFTYRIALCLDTPSQVDMVLGDDMRERGAPADEIPLTAPGTGYVVSEFERDPFRVRAAYVDDDEIRDMASEYAPITDQLNDIETPTPAAWPGSVEPEPFIPDAGVPVVPESLLAKLRTMPAPAVEDQAVNGDQAPSKQRPTDGTEAA
jgi:S-DNA-T family DNA segregation ATPase FtsK/SpoIIIE